MTFDRKITLARNHDFLSINATTKKSYECGRYGREEEIVINKENLTNLEKRGIFAGVYLVKDGDGYFLQRLCPSDWSPLYCNNRFLQTVITKEEEERIKSEIEEYDKINGKYSFLGLMLAY